MLKDSSSGSSNNGSIVGREGGFGGGGFRTRVEFPLALAAADPIEELFLKLSPARLFLVVSLSLVLVGASANAPWARRCLVDSPLPELGGGGGGGTTREEPDALRWMWAGRAKVGMVGVEDDLEANGIVGVAGLAAGIAGVAGFADGIVGVEGLLAKAGVADGIVGVEVFPKGRDGNVDEDAEPVLLLTVRLGRGREGAEDV